jgi:hypothetical protein
VTTNQIVRAAGLAAIAYLFWTTVVTRVDPWYAWAITIALQILLVSILIWIFYATRPQSRHTAHPSTVRSRIHAVRDRSSREREYPEGP